MYNNITKMYDGIIYCFTNKINNKKYIGQTQCSLKKRISEHLSKTGKKYYFQKALQKYGIDNFNITVLDSLSSSTKEDLKQQLNNREKYYIKKWKTTDRDFGYNLTKGGECASINKGRPVYQFDLNTNKLIKKYDSMAEASRAIVGKPDTNNIYLCATHETKQAYGYIWEFGPICNRKYVPTEHLPRPEQYKIICQYSINGELIKKWESIKDAANYINVDRSTLTQCCQGKISTVKNYVWRYEEDKFDKYPVTFRGKIIACFDDEHNLVHIFKNAPSAANYYNCSDSCIKSALRDNNKKSAGYYWRYYTENFNINELIFKTEENKGKGLVA